MTAAGLSLLLAIGSLAAPPRKAPKTAKVDLVDQTARAVTRTARSYLPEEDVKHKRRPRDCSDFVDRVFAQNGLKLPRTAAEMSVAGTRVPSSRDLRMGDLVFFSGEKISRIVGHVGIYVNNGIFIHVSRPKVGARMESLYSDYYRRRYLTARRVIPELLRRRRR